MGSYFQMLSSNLGHSTMPNKPAKLVYSNGLITANGQQRRNKLTLAGDILFTTPVVAKQGHKRMI